MATIKQNGPERTYHPNGQIESEVTYLDGKLTGISRSWHSNGVLESELPVKNGLGNGLCKQWDSNGRLLGVFEMKMGTGMFRKWYENGRLQSEMSYVNGVGNGRGRFWDENGMLISEGYFVNFCKVSQKKYFEACAKNASLPRYKEDDVKSTFKLPSTRYRRRGTSVSEEERRRHDDFIAKFRAKPNQAEARQWLAASPATVTRSLGEMDSDGSREVVEEGYAAGAQKIIAVDIQSNHETNETTNCFIVELPEKGPKRKLAFEWVNVLAQQSGFDPEIDWGQAELFIFLD
jgi:hypothetical protein